MHTALDNVSNQSRQLDRISLISGLAAGAAGASLVSWLLVRSAKADRNRTAIPAASQTGLVAGYLTPKVPTDDVFDQADTQLSQLRLAETVLQNRVDQVICVLENLAPAQVVELLQVCECLGIQHVWIIEAAQQQRKARPWEKASSEGVAPSYLSSPPAQWLTIRRFKTGQEAVAALQQEGKAVWVADTSQEAQRLHKDNESLWIPSLWGVSDQTEAPSTDSEDDSTSHANSYTGVAVAFGQGGVSQAVKDAAQALVYCPIRGATQTMPLIAAVTATMQRIMSCMPRIGPLPKSMQQELRQAWYRRLAGDGATLLAQYLAQLESPPPPFSDTRLHSSHRAPKQLGVLPGLPFNQQPTGRPYAEAVTPQTSGSSATGKPDSGFSAYGNASTSTQGRAGSEQRPESSAGSQGVSHANPLYTDDKSGEVAGDQTKTGADASFDGTFHGQAASSQSYTHPTSTLSANSRQHAFPAAIGMPHVPSLQLPNSSLQPASASVHGSVPGSPSASSVTSSYVDASPRSVRSSIDANARRRSEMLRRQLRPGPASFPLSPAASLTSNNLSLRSPSGVLGSPAAVISSSRMTIGSPSSRLGSPAASNTSPYRSPGSTMGSAPATPKSNH